MLEKFVRPANENFTMFCNKVVYESWWTLFPILVLKKLKAFAFICTVSIRGRLNNDPLYIKTLEKFVPPANENFITFWKKHVYESWRKSFPTLVSKKLKTFAFICILSIRGKLNSAQKLVQPANENLTTFCKKHVFELWRKLFPTLVLKELKAFAFVCIVSIRGRLNCAPLYLKMFEKFVQPANEKLYNILQKTVYELSLIHI